MSTLVELRIESRGRLGVASGRRATMTQRGRYDVRVHGLTPDQARSLTAALSAAAMVVEMDPARRALCVPRSRNRAFRLEDVATVIREWLAEDGQRQPLITLVDQRAPER